MICFSLVITYQLVMRSLNVLPSDNFLCDVTAYFEGIFLFLLRSKRLISELTLTGNGVPKTGKNPLGRVQTDQNL